MSQQLSILPLGVKETEGMGGGEVKGYGTGHILTYLHARESNKGKCCEWVLKSNGKHLS